MEYSYEDLNMHSDTKHIQ